MSNWDNQEKSGNGTGWEYDETNLSYNQANDPESNSIVYYNTIGTLPTFTNLTKN